jgi:hypothetical protein
VIVFIKPIAIGDCVDTSKSLSTLNTLRIFNMFNQASDENTSPIKNGAKDKKSMIFIHLSIKAFFSHALINLYAYSTANMSDTHASMKRSSRKYFVPYAPVVSSIIAPTAINTQICINHDNLLPVVLFGSSRIFS